MEARACSLLLDEMARSQEGDVVGTSRVVKTMCIMYILYAISTWGIKCECPCFKVKVDI